MIIVRVELDSAIHPSRDIELARMEIANDSPREAEHVWNLVAKALTKMGYGT